VTGTGSARPAYLPILALPYWVIIGPFVEAAVRDSAAGCGRSERDLFAAATPMVLWAWQSRGVPLERTRVFRHSLVEQFIHLGMPGAARGSRATLRSTLWRMTEILNPADSPGAHRPIPRSIPTAAYSEAAIAELYSWANTQNTPARSRNALALLCLGFGAGLATRELLDVRVTDISTDMSTDIDIRATGSGTAAVVVWSDRPRVVPFRQEWTPTLLTVLNDTADDSWLFRPGRAGTSAGQVTDFLTRSRTHLDVRPSRMRTTWLLQHLAEGMPAADLLRISGLKNYAALDKLVPFVPPGAGSENSLNKL
jgi:integrase